MKKYAVFILCFVTVSAALAPCCGRGAGIPQPEAASIQLDSETAGGITVTAGKAKVSVDPRMELLAVVQCLADDPIIRKNGLEAASAAYSRDIQRHFASFQAAPVVGLYQQMRASGFSFGRVPELTVRLDATLHLRENSPGFGDYVRRSGVTQAKLGQFLEALANFRRDSAFDAFFADHTPYYRTLTTKVQAALQKSGALMQLATFYGYEQNSYQITLYPLAAGGFAERVPRANGRYAVYVFATVPADEVGFARLLLHEIGHSYTGPLAYNVHARALEQYRRLYQPIEASMKRQNYHSWLNCVDEHVNRAVTARLLQQIYNGQIGQRELEQNQQRDFIYTEAIYQRLADYEQNRDKYPTFEQFYPQIVKLFGELAQ